MAVKTLTSIYFVPTQVWVGNQHPHPNSFTSACRGREDKISRESAPIENPCSRVKALRCS